MYKEKADRRFLALGFVLLCAGLAAGALWDLSLDAAIHDPSFLPAILMEAFGWFPQYLPAVLLLACFAADRRPGHAVRAVCGAAAAAGYGVLVYMGAHHLVQRGMPRSALLLWTSLFGAAALALCALALWLCRGARLQKLQFVCFWGTVYLLLGLAAINLLKAIWQRTRFDDMLALGDLTGFTGWFQPFGNGGSSFPSGHTAAACSIFVLVLACDVFPRLHAHRTLIWAASWAYVAGMAVCRLIIGRHYLSDTIASAFVMTALYFVLVRCKWYRAGARRLTNCVR